MKNEGERRRGERRRERRRERKGARKQGKFLIEIRPRAAAAKWGLPHWQGRGPRPLSAKIIDIPRSNVKR